MILVAGGTGRLGVPLVRTLVDSGHDVRVLTRDPAHADPLRPLGVEVVTGDVRDRQAVAAAVAGTDVVVSAVHGFVGPRGVSPATVDRDGNAVLVESAATEGADVVLMSIVGATSRSPMELLRMKYAAEQHLRASGVPGAVVRATAFTELWTDLLRQTARGGRPLVFGRGDNPINFVSVRDVAALVARVVDDPDMRGRDADIGGPDNLTFNELAALVQAADGSSGGIRHVPRAALKVGAQTVGRAVPAVGRQMRAALAMDDQPLRFDADTARERYPDLPRTSVADVLAGPRTS